MVLLNDVIQGSGADGHPDLWGFGDGQKAFFSLKQGKPDPASFRDFVERPWARINIRGAADVPETN